MGSYRSKISSNSIRWSSVEGKRTNDCFIRTDRDTGLLKTVETRIRSVTGRNTFHSHKFSLFAVEINFTPRRSDELIKNARCRTKTRAITTPTSGRNFHVNLTCIFFPSSLCQRPYASSPTHSPTDRIASVNGSWNERMPLIPVKLIFLASLRSFYFFLLENRFTVWKCFVVEIKRVVIFTTLRVFECNSSSSITLYIWGKLRVARTCARMLAV